ncbi:MAG TPA: hypothetical protein VLD65_01450 [Anaerolineales bacterium]|nr:hypothetical protein [Anaerolineales bacterium]
MGKHLASWLESIFHTQSEEISCTECFDLVSSYVELEIRGNDPAIKHPKVKQHLGQCAACREEYETLRDLRQLEEEQGIPSIDDLRNKIH